MKKVSFIFIFAIFIFSSYGRVGAQGYLGSYNALPDAKQVDNYTYNSADPDGPRNKYGDDGMGYLVVGNGEFERYSLVLTIESPKKDLWIDIEHAAVCNNKSNPAHYTGIDSPDNGSGVPTTTYHFGNKFTDSILDQAKEIQTITTQRDCGNPNRRVKLEGLEKLPDQPDRFGGWVYVSFSYTGTGSIQNSFRLVATDEPSAIIGYSSEVIEGLKTNNQGVLDSLGVSAQIGISLTNTDLPQYSYTDYSLTMTIPCTARATDLDSISSITFFDLDDTTGASWDTGVGSFWQGTSTIAHTEFMVREGTPVRNSDGETIRVDWETVISTPLTGKGSGRGDEITKKFQKNVNGRNVSIFQPDRIYRFRIKNVYRANAIQFTLSGNIPLRSGEPPKGGCGGRIKDPVAFAEQCSVVNGRTVIKGWAYDNDSSDPVQPRVDVKVGATDYNNLASNLSYRTTYVENYVDDNGYGPDGKDNRYGWELTVDGLEKGRRYNISGTVNDVGEGTDQPIIVNNANWIELVDGSRQDVNGFPNNRIPDKCIPSSPLVIAACSFVGFSASEPGITGDFTIDVEAGPAEDISVVSTEVLNYGNFDPDSNMLNNYASSPIKVTKATSREFKSKTGKFPSPRKYDNVQARVAYVYANNGSIVGGSTTCDNDFDINIKPYLKVYGGDVWSGGRFPGSTATNQGSIYAHANASGANSTGAASQLGVMALLNIRGFYSSSLRTSLFTATAPKGTTFANTSNSTFGGSFGAGASLNLIDYYQDTRDTSLGSSNMPASVPAGQGKVQYVLPANSNIGARTIGRGSQVATYVNGDVFISGDIAYDASGRTLTTDVPFFALIVKGDIYIGGNVTRLDGMYVAQSYMSGGNELGGKIYTCSAGLRSRYSSAGAAIANNCGNKLTINGSFTAKQIKFLRHIQTLSLAPTRETRQSNGAGEVFNFSPELYIAPSPLRNGDSNGGETIKYDAIFSLPPVF